jgi:hypothetical protein
VECPVAITADVSCRLLEVDYAGVENVLTGYYLWHHGIETPDGAAGYIRWCNLGLHAAVTAIKVGDPAFPNWPDDRISAHLAKIKSAHATEYDIIKRVDHGTNYGLTPYGMTEMFPEYFHSVAEAQKGQEFLFTLAPGLPKWHHALRKQARDVGYLGGVTLPPAAPSRWDHPFGYRHWWWDVLSYKPTDEVTARKWLANPKQRDRIVVLHGRYFKIDYGGDSKRVIAFYPQSTGSAILKRAELRLFSPWSPDYIGDCYFGRTPLLHPIHDALLLHVPNSIYDRIVAIVVRVMQDEIRQLPIPPEWHMGKYLRIGVAAKGGRTWDSRDMKKLRVEPIQYGVELPEDNPVIPREDTSHEDWDALARSVA